VCVVSEGERGGGGGEEGEEGGGGGGGGGSIAFSHYVLRVVRY